MLLLLQAPLYWEHQPLGREGCRSHFPKSRTFSQQLQSRRPDRRPARVMTEWCAEFVWMQTSYAYVSICVCIVSFGKVSLHEWLHWNFFSNPFAGCTCLQNVLLWRCISGEWMECRQSYGLRFDDPSPQVHSDLTEHAQVWRTRTNRSRGTTTLETIPSIALLRGLACLFIFCLFVLNWMVLVLVLASGSVSGRTALRTTLIERSGQHSGRYLLGNQKARASISRLVSVHNSGQHDSVTKESFKTRV